MVLHGDQANVALFFPREWRSVSPGRLSALSFSLSLWGPALALSNLFLPFAVLFPMGSLRPPPHLNRLPRGYDAE